jgi:hypothetical protein
VCLFVSVCVVVCVRPCVCFSVSICGCVNVFLFACVCVAHVVWVVFLLMHSLSEAAIAPEPLSANRKEVTTCFARGSRCAMFLSEPSSINSPHIHSLEQKRPIPTWSRSGPTIEFTTHSSHPNQFSSEPDTSGGVSLCLFVPVCTCARVCFSLHLCHCLCSVLFLCVNFKVGFTTTAVHSFARSEPDLVPKRVHNRVQDA